jgi:thiosulfate dehydrogenase
MTKRAWKAVGLMAAAAAGTAAASARHPFPESRNGNVVVGLCDGQTWMEVPGVAPGRAMARPEAQRVADALMSEWRRKNPGPGWEEPLLAQARANQPAPPPVRGEGETAASGARQAPAARSANVQSGHTYGNFSARDEKIWAASTQQFVDYGKKVFHDAKAVGGTVGISCDMCHPDGVNTHPETYPKYQVQLGRVALLRDMINWCIENPVRGKPLPDDSDEIRGIEAYILAQRKGVALDYGKH